MRSTVLVRISFNPPKAFVSIFLSVPLGFLSVSAGALSVRWLFCSGTNRVANNPVVLKIQLAMKGIMVPKLSRKLARGALVSSTAPSRI